MKALVLSDSHGWEQEVQTVVERHHYDVDAMFHCGDSELNHQAIPLKGVQTVKGNCDFTASFPKEIVESVNGTKFFISHGHLLNVKMTEMNLIYRGEEVGADVICHGHTHIPYATQENGMILLNPGSLRLPREYPIGTYAIVETTIENIKVDFYSIDGKKMEDLSKEFIKKH